MRRKGFTLVELLVVIAIIALLMGILMPALARVRQMAYRMVCGTRQSGLGKALLVYSQDHDDDYPRSGGRDIGWNSDGEIDNWDATDEEYAFDEDEGATIGSCFYLLVKYADVTLKQFICNGDLDSEVFKMSDYEPVNSEEEIDAWDFGTHPGIHCSYSYHMPFEWNTGCNAGTTSYPIGTTSNPSSPVCADRNPYLDKNAEGADGTAGGYVEGQLEPDEDPPTWENNELSDPDKTMNAAAHQREGQNVLYNDISVRFQTQPNCGIANDNIYKHWTTCPENNPSDEEKQKGDEDKGGGGQKTGEGGPMSEVDAFLVNEHQDTGTSL